MRTFHKGLKVVLNIITSIIYGLLKLLVGMSVVITLKNGMLAML